MKALFKLFLAVAAGMFALSCVTDATEDLGVNLGGQTTEISISLEESRTHIADKDGDSYPLYWSEGDKIAVNGVASAPLAKEAHGKSSATFVLDGVVAYPHNIVYPAPAEGVTAAEGLQVVTFPATQNYVAGSFDEGAAPMYAYVSDAEAQTTLHHLAGVLRIAVKGNGEKLTAMTIATESAKIAGNFDIDCTSGALTAQADATNAINVNFSEPVTLGAEATPIYVALPAGKHGVMTVTLTADDTIMELLFNSTIHAGVVKEFAEVTYKAGALAEPEGDLVITSEAELQQLAKLSAVGKLSKVTSVTIGATIDMTGKEWTPIEGFDATFDGGSDKGYEIKGLIKPLFGTTSAAIKNLKLTDVNISETAPYVLNDIMYAYAGSIAYRINSGSLANCYTSGKIDVNMTYDNPTGTPTSNYNVAISPVVGMLNATNVDGCENHIDLTVTNLNCIPLAKTTTTKDETTGEDVATTTYANFYSNCAGMFAVVNNVGTIKNCTNYGDTTIVNYNTVATLRFGSIAGVTLEKAITFTSCHNYGDMEVKAVNSGGSAYCGGIVGYANKAITITSSSSNGAFTVGKDVTTKDNLYFGAMVSMTSSTFTTTDCSSTNNAQGKGFTTSASVSQFYPGWVGKGATGQVTHTIKNCWNDTDFTATSDFNTTSSCYMTLGISDAVSGAKCSYNIENFTASGDMNFYGTAGNYFYSGAIFGYWRGSGTMKITNCISTGTHTYDATFKGRTTIAGLVGYKSSKPGITFTTCENASDIFVHNKNGAAVESYCAVAGIIAYSGSSANDFNGVLNSGDITLTGKYNFTASATLVGGIEAYANYHPKYTKVESTGDIYLGTAEKSAKFDTHLQVGGAFGNVVGASTAFTAVQCTGDITVQNATFVNDKTLIGGLAGKSGKAVTGTYFGKISAVGVTNVGMVQGLDRATKASSKCKVGGSIAVANGENGKPFFRTLVAAVDGSNGKENADGSVTNLLPEFVMYYDVMYGGTTDWTGDTTSYDGCTLTDEPSSFGITATGCPAK